VIAYISNSIEKDMWKELF